MDTLQLIDNVHEYNLEPSNYAVYKGNVGPDFNVDELGYLPFKENVESIDYSSGDLESNWLKIVLKDLTTWKKRYVFEVYDVHIDDFRLYVPDNHGKYFEKRAGNKMNFNDRDDYAVTNFVFDIPLKRNGPTILYVKVKSKDHLHYDFHIKTQNFFTSYATNEYHYLGYYYGILFIMAAYNLLLFITSRERVYFYYVLYVLSCMIYSYSDDGLGFQYWWPHHPTWNIPISYYIGPVAFVGTFVLYSRKFLDLKKLHPRLDKLLLISLGIYLLYLPFEIFVLPPEYHLNQLFSIPFIVVYAASIYVFKKGYKAGRFFIVGYTFVFVAVMLFQLRNYELIAAPSGFWAIILVYSFKIGIVLEILVLSYALGDRIKILKEAREKDQKIIIEQLEQNKNLQEKVNRELENEVELRTKELKGTAMELQEANSKLEQLTEQLNEANAKLDYDNWQLVKEVKKEKKARLLSRKMSHVEFMNVFVDDLTCNKHLESLKWPNGFKCRKCKNEKFIKRSRLLSRKCTKCNHIESVLADTVFQGVKFPIAKAFYITYLTCQKDSKSTVNELADKLELARNTCWKFRKKVQDRIEVVKSQYPDVDWTNWESIILIK